MANRLAGAANHHDVALNSARILHANINVELRNGPALSQHVGDCGAIELVAAKLRSSVKVTGEP
jgi:hypothetical protein